MNEHPKRGTQEYEALPDYLQLYIDHVLNDTYPVETAYEVRLQEALEDQCHDEPQVLQK